ncbi:MAG: OmpA family protein [Bacteroidia bacterium]|nr:OmpA family protein [Bacteroidia bacterium]
MNRKIFVSCAVLALSMLGISEAVAQNYLHKFGFEISGGLREYGGDRGTRYFLAEKPEYQAIGGSFGYYINPTFDATVYGSVGMLGHRDDSYPRKLGFTAQVTDLMFGLRMKLANGKIMSEESRFKPYLQAGWGGMQSISKIIHEQEGYAENFTNNRTWIAAHFSAGGGVRIALTDFVDLSLQMMYNYTYDDNYDGLPFSLSKVRLNALHDAYLYHTAGLVFNFGESNSTYHFKPEDEIPEELVKKVNLAAKNVHFETASATIKQESYADLDSIVEILLDNPTINVYVEGHTDNVGNPADNMTLSQKRAESVKAYLVGKGVDATRLEAKGYGETQPIADNSTEEGRALNRRVEVKMYYRK